MEERGDSGREGGRDTKDNVGIEGELSLSLLTVPLSKCYYLQHM